MKTALKTTYLWCPDKMLEAAEKVKHRSVGREKGKEREEMARGRIWRILRVAG